MNITIKEKAEIMLNDKLESGQFLRISVVEGGCAGLTYGAEVDQEIRDEDEVVLEKGDIRLVSDENSRKYLDGLIIDYSDDLINGGLQFTNSNTKTTCGCGASFSLSGFPVIEDGTCRK